MSRPAPWKLSEIPTLWLDVETGAGVDDAGAPVRPILGGRRKKPALVDLLNTAAHHRATRIMLSGQVPGRVGDEDALAAGGHRRAGRRPGTTSRTTGRRPAGSSSPPPGTGWRSGSRGSGSAPTGSRRRRRGRRCSCCRWSWRRRCPVIWPRHRPRPGRTSGPTRCRRTWTRRCLAPDLAELIHHTSGQHRTEHLVEGRSRCDCGDCLPLIPAKTEIPGFCYVDGRFMYSALCREVGVGGRRLTQARRRRRGRRGLLRPGPVPGPVHRAGWWDTLGLLGVFRPDTAQWHYPNRPGASYDTWVDAVELPHRAQPCGATGRSRFWRGSRSTGAGRWTTSPPGS